MKHLIQNTAKTTLLGYKNFFHWNLSKIIIAVVSILLSILGTLPFAIITYIYTLTNDFPWTEFITWFLSWSIPAGVGQAMLSELPWFFMWAVLLIITFLMAYILFGFSRILLIRVALDYADKKKGFGFLKELLNITLIRKYFAFSLFRGLLLIIPGIILAIFVGLLILFSGGVENVYSLVVVSEFNAFTIATLIATVIAGLVSAYIYFRTYFAFYCFADKKIDAKQGVIAIYKESIYHTKGWKKLAKFILLWIVFLIIFMPFNYIVNSNNTNIERIPYYIQFMQNDAETQDYIRQKNPALVTELELDFKWFSESELITRLQIAQIMSFIFPIFAFLFSYGLVELYFLAYYRKKIQPHL